MNFSQALENFNFALDNNDRLRWGRVLLHRAAKEAVDVSLLQEYLGTLEEDRLAALEDANTTGQKRVASEWEYDTLASLRRHSQEWKLTLDRKALKKHISVKRKAQRKAKHS